MKTRFFWLFLVVFGCFFILSCRKQGNFVDKRDGKKYKIVKINGKWWMAENLNYYPQNGFSWCYDDNIRNCNEYGRLYNWTTALNVCPEGWSLPTYEDWESMINYYKKENTPLKHDNEKYWTKLSNEPNNRSGFSAIPSGYRGYHGYYFRLGEMGFYWSSTESKAYYSWCLIVDNSSKEAVLAENVALVGLSVRCVKD